MKKIAFLALLCLAVPILITACHPKPQQEPTALDAARGDELTALAIQLTDYLQNGEYDEISGMLDATMQKAMPADKLEEMWNQLCAQCGAYQGHGDARAFAEEGYEIVEVRQAFANASLIQRTVFSEDKLVSGLFYRLDAAAQPQTPEPQAHAPQGVVETEVTIDSQKDYPLHGTLTMPPGNKPAAAIVLVHGSGPHDRDSTIGPNKPLRDIAWGLAQRNIAVLRYDKITYTYAQQLAQNPGNKTFSVNEETVLDAVSATKFLKAQTGIPQDKVFLLGHSMGGMLASYMDAQGADAAGLVLLAGTPRKLWQLSADQSEAMASAYEQQGKAKDAQALRDSVQAETQKAAKLASMTEAEAQNAQETIFGLPAYYQWVLEHIDSMALHNQIGKPVLVLQGGKDQQVLPDVDYPLWQQGLSPALQPEFKLYPELNHIFGAYQGDPVTIDELVSVEYAQDTPVPDQVIQDIADFMLR